MTWPQYLRRECNVGDFVVHLSAVEVELLFVLLVRYPEPVSPGDLIGALYPDPDHEPEGADAVVKNGMNRLRWKLGGFRVHARAGYGYRLCQLPCDLKHAA